MRDFSVLKDGALGEWTNVSFSEANMFHRSYVSWQGCPSEMDQPAAHFLGRGYIILKQPLGVVEIGSWQLEIQFRLAFTSGILFYASGDDDEFMMGSLSNGTVR